MAPEQITADWLDAALDRSGGRPAVVGAELDHVVAGTTTKVFVRAELEDGDELALCIKSVFDEPRDTVRTYAARLEANFFRDLAPTLDIPLFRTWFAGTDADQGIVVFDDLRETGTRFTEVAETWTADRVAAALESQAAWHAATWDLPQGRFDWLAHGNQILGMAAEQLFSAPHWDAHVPSPDTVEVPDSLADRELMLTTMHRLFALHDTQVHVLSHGDAHVGNTYTDPSGRIGFYDWQSVCTAPALDDVAYFIVGALDVEDRRRHERELLNHYLDALRGAGGPELDRETAWLDHRRQHAHGFFWAVIPTTWQPPSASIPMAERYIAAIADHDTVGLLEDAVR
ncbi:hypothetical protein BST36_23630 [Mycolicibacterium moriokaense]|nr:hypothetical protein BST36_23630 [Mycolicibacterium moriokaense]